MSIYKKKGVTYITFDLLEDYGVKHGVFMRHGGVSPVPWRSLNMATSVGDSRENVLENRNRITTALGLKEDSIFDLWQIHSKKIIHADKPRAKNQAHSKGDAIITNKMNISLLMLFADCVPVLLADVDKKVVAIVHAGWQGTYKGIVTDTVNEMKRAYDCQPENILAGIGPAICQKHYEVGEDVIQIFNNEYQGSEKIIKSENSKTYLDLKHANFLLLKKAKIRQVEVMDICTACLTEDWYSHRAENQTGRFGVLISNQ